MNLSSVDAAVVLGIALASAALAYRGVRGLREARALRSLPMRALGSLREGAVAVRGRLVCNAPLRSCVGDDCAALRRRGQMMSGSGRGARTKIIPTKLEVAPARLVVGNHSCALDLSGGVLFGERWSGVARGQFWEEILLPVGALVTVYGVARVDGLEAGDGYREESARWKIASTGSMRLVVSTSDPTETLWRSAWPSLIELACALSLAALAGWFAWGLSRLPTAFFDAAPWL